MTISHTVSNFSSPTGSNLVSAMQSADVTPRNVPSTNTQESATCNTVSFHKRSYLSDRRNCTENFKKSAASTPVKSSSNKNNSQSSTASNRSSERQIALGKINLEVVIAPNRSMKELGKIVLASSETKKEHPNSSRVSKKPSVADLDLTPYTSTPGNKETSKADSSRLFGEVPLVLTREQMAKGINKAYKSPFETTSIKQSKQPVKSAKLAKK